jgi:hypothetical protein
MKKIDRNNNEIRVRESEEVLLEEQQLISHPLQSKDSLGKAGQIRNEIVPSNDVKKTKAELKKDKVIDEFYMKEIFSFENFFRITTEVRALR